MGNSSEKKVSISSANPIVITANTPISKPSLLLYAAVTVSLLGSVGLGLVVGYISPVLDQITDANDPKDAQARTWLGSITTLGALCGGLLASILVKFLGKKLSLGANGILFTIGWMCIYFDSTPSFLYFYIGRFITGLCSGLVCAIAPGYVTEISTLQKRGFFGSCFQLFITIGILLASIVGNQLKYKAFAIFCGIPPVIMTIFMLFMPESPAQILAQYKLDDFVIKRARNELAKLRSPDSAVDEELDELIKAQKALNEITDENLSEKISKVDFYKPLAYSLILMFIQQMSGINAILFYANSIFKSASETINVAVASSVLSLTMTLTTVVEIFIIDKLGRRFILILSGVGCAIGMGLMGIFYTLKSHDPSFAEKYGWVPLFALVFYIIAFSLGLAPVPWMMVPELTPVNNRNFISGCSTAFNWGIAFLVTKYFEPISKLIELHGAYFMFMVFTLLGVAFVSIFLPETGGRSINDLCKVYASGWRNSIFVKYNNDKDSIAFNVQRSSDQKNNDSENQSNNFI